MTFEFAVAMLVSFGFTVSPGSYDFDNLLYVFSNEVAKGTMGHPKAGVLYNKETGHLTIDNGQTVKHAKVVNIVGRDT